ncbi:MAG: four helix bundle protein [Flavisolibacter sp.]|nr:four helix bundle protein [Flavisolibacter sp.]
MGDYKDLIVYQKAYRLAMDIFHITKSFPADEKYSLSDQIKRSSRSVCANLAEAYRRRKYKAHFISKLTDSETENTETEVWIDFSKDCNYINSETYTDLFSRNAEVRKIIFYMINNPDKFM